MGEWCIIRSGAEGGYASLQGGVQEAKPSQRAGPPSVPPGAPSRRRVRSAQVRASGHRSRPGPASAARPQRTPAGARRVQARSRAQPAAVTLAGPSGRSEMLSRAVPGGSRAWACLPAVVEGRAQAGCRARSCSPGRVETRAVAQAGQGSGAGEHMMAALAAARVHGSLNQRAERVTPRASSDTRCDAAEPGAGMPQIFGASLGALRTYPGTKFSYKLPPELLLCTGEQNNRPELVQSESLRGDLLWCGIPLPRLRAVRLWYRPRYRQKPRTTLILVQASFPRP